MHTFTATDGTVFIFSPDLSDVRINVLSEDIEDISDLQDMGNPLSQVQVSGPAMREFVVAYLRDAIVSELENLDLNKLFQGLM